MGIREDKKSIIIKSAEKVFIDKGMFKTSMNDIAQEAGITRRTLYRYFSTKEDAAYEVTIELLNRWNNYINEVFRELQGDGITRLQGFFLALIDYMDKRRGIMRYLGEFDFFFTDEDVQEPSFDSKERYNSIILHSDMMIGSILSKGINDGSIRKDIDIHLTVATMSNVLWSFGQSVALRGNIIQKETGIKSISLIENQVELYIKALKEE